MLSPFFAEQGAHDAAKAGLQVLTSDPKYSGILTSLASGSYENAELTAEEVEPEHPLFRLLLEITHAYWVWRRVYNRKSPAEFNAELAKIRNAIVNLQRTLSNAPPFVRGALDVQLGTLATHVRLGLSDCRETRLLVSCLANIDYYLRGE